MYVHTHTHTKKKTVLILAVNEVFVLKKVVLKKAFSISGQMVQSSKRELRVLHRKPVLRGI